jgi:hypothetical protein
MMKQFLQVCSWGILAILSVGSLAPARAQTSQGSVTPVQGPSSSSAQEKPRPKRTWTEDDVTSLRKPWDNYEYEKALAAQSSATASTSAKQQSAVPPSAGSTSQTRASSDPSLPKTNEEAEAQIHEKEAEIRQKQQVLDKSSRDLESADNDFDRSALKSNVEIAKVDLETSKDDLKQLQARQAELKSKATAPPGSEQANPPAQ